MTDRKALEKFMADKSEEEIRARAEAAALGQLLIQNAVITALLSVTAAPEHVERAITAELGRIASETVPYPELEWSIAATLQGAEALARPLIATLQSNPAYPSS